ncbi:MAG: hypothetical protein ABI679_15385 [Gemmatimonadota bacterium]
MRTPGITTPADRPATIEEETRMMLPDKGAVIYGADGLASTTHPRRLLTLTEVANVAAVMAFDKAAGMTGTTVNLTMRSLDD